MIRRFQTSLDDYEKKKIYHRDRDDENSDLEKNGYFLVLVLLV